MSYLDSQQQAATKVQLDYAATTDIAVGLSLPATTWTDLVSNLSFTVDDPNSVIEIAVSGLYLVGNTANTDFGIRLVIDSAGTPINKMCGGNRIPAAVYTNCLTGVDSVVVTGLSAGTHTVKIQINPSVSSLGYCQPASTPTTYNFQLRVLERKVLPSIFSGPQPTTKVQLDYVASSDLMSGTTLTASTWTDVLSNQNFTVDDPNSIVEISVNAGIMAGGIATVQNTVARLVVDSAGTAVNKNLGSGRTVASEYGPILAGCPPITLTGLAAGSHTVKLQVWSDGAVHVYCQPSSQPINQFFELRVLERKQTAALVSNCLVKLDEKIVGAGGQASIAFSNIPQGYRSLQLCITGRSDAATSFVRLRLQLNGDTTSGNYIWEYVDWYGSAGTLDAGEGTSDTAITCGTVSAATAIASVPATNIVNIPAYTGTVFVKTILSQYNLFNATSSFGQASGHMPGVAAGWWNSTAAITSILLFPASGNLIAGSVVSLYGLT